MLGFFSTCCPAAVGRLVQQLYGKPSDLPVDVPNEVVDDADRVILDTAHFLGGPRKRPLSSRTLSGSWAIDLWTSSTVVAPFSIASVMNLTRVFHLPVRSVAIAGSSEKRLQQRTCLLPILCRARRLSRVVASAGITTSARLPAREQWPQEASHPSVSAPLRRTHHARRRARDRLGSICQRLVRFPWGGTAESAVRTTTWMRSEERAASAARATMPVWHDVLLPGFALSSLAVLSTRGGSQHAGGTERLVGRPAAREVCCPVGVLQEEADGVVSALSHLAVDGKRSVTRQLFEPPA